MRHPCTQIAVLLGLLLPQLGRKPKPCRSPCPNASPWQMYAWSPPKAVAKPSSTWPAAL